MLEEKGLPYEAKMVDRAAKPREVLEVSPRGTSPVVYDGGVKLRESLLINEYLDERYPSPALMPREPGARAQVRLAIDGLNDLLGPLGVFVREKLGMDKPGDEARAGAKVALTAAAAELDRSLAARRFLAGDALTLADAALFANVHGATGLLGRDFLFAGAPHLARWYDELAARPAFQRAIAKGKAQAS